MVKKIGIALDHLGSTQPAFFMINYINNILTQSNKYDFTLFYTEHVAPCTKPLCATMSMAESWLYDGDIITTSINTTLTIKDAILPKRKLFYISDLEWLRNGKRNFIYNIQAYRDQSVELVVRSQSHGLVLSHYANRIPDANIPDFNLYLMLHYLENTNGPRKSNTNV